MGLGRTRLAVKNLKSFELCHMLTDTESILHNIRDAINDNTFEKNNVLFQISIHIFAKTSFMICVDAFDSERYSVLSGKEIHERFESEAAVKSCLADGIERFINELNDANVTFKYIDMSANPGFRVENGVLYAPVYNFEKGTKLDVDFEVKDYSMQFEVPDVDKIVGGLLYEH